MICGLIAGLIFFVDLLLPLGVAAAVPYVVVVAITVWGEKPKIEFAVAFVTSLLTVAGFFFSPEGGELWKVLINRGLALSLIWGSAGIVYARRTYIAQMTDANRELNALRSELEVKVAQRTYELAERESLLEDVLDTTDMAFLLVSPMGHIHMGNRAARMVFDCERGSFDGWNIKSLFRTGQNVEIDYLLATRNRKAPRVVPVLETSDRKGNARTVTVKAIPAQGDISDMILLSITTVES